MRLDVKLRRGVPKAVTFEAQNVLLFCDDDTEQRISVGPLRVPMRTHAAFSRTIVRGQPGADRTYIGVDGRIARKRAHGFLYYFSDPWDPPGLPYVADCSGAFGRDTGGVDGEAAMRRVARHHWVALVATFVCVTAAAGPFSTDRLAARGDPPRLTFRGHLVGDPSASVLLRQGTRHGNRRRGRFEAQNVPLLCDDGSTPLVQRRTGFVRFAANGTFANLFSRGLSQGFESFFRVDGRARSRRRAEGTIFIYQDPRDPPSGPEAAECSTPEPLRWKAETPGSSLLRHIDDNDVRVR